MPARSVYLTFDDGAQGLWRYADPVLARHRMRAAAFLITRHVGGRHSYYLSWDEVGRMARSGRWDFQSHTTTRTGGGRWTRPGTPPRRSPTGCGCPAASAWRPRRSTGGGWRATWTGRSPTSPGTACPPGPVRVSVLRVGGTLQPRAGRPLVAPSARGPLHRGPDQRHPPSAARRTPGGGGREVRRLEVTARTTARACSTGSPSGRRSPRTPNPGRWRGPPDGGSRAAHASSGPARSPGPVRTPGGTAV
ncbi:polysaccharide deacetylase family protein [Streptomyces sp. M19]